MSLYDRMSNTIKGAGQKASGAFDSSKLNGKISENNKRISQLYMEMGEIYFNLHQKNPEEKLAQHVKAVAQMKSEIQEWNDQIQALHGMVKCPNCQNYVSNHALFCNECGTRLLPETAIVCPQCNTVAEQGMMFCPSCGFRLPNKQEQNSGAGSTGIRCSVCGNEIGQDEMFCTNCGAPRPAAGPTKTTPPENGKSEPDEAEGTTEPDKAEEPAETDDAKESAETGGTEEPAETGGAEEPAETIGDVSTVSEENASEPEYKICPQCGAKQPASTLFCMECGTKF